MKILSNPSLKQMPQKPSKRKPQASSRSVVKKQEQASHTPNIPWPNLPNQLTSLLAKHPNLMYNINSFGCVVKLWRQSHKQCKKFKPPHLIEVDLKHRQDTMFSHVFEISFHEGFRYWYYKRWQRNYCPRVYFKGYSHGQVVVMAENTYISYTWQPARTGKGHRFLPSWNTKLPFKACVLSSYYKDSKVPDVMAITGISSPAFAFFRSGNRLIDKAWTFQNCTIEEPYVPGEYMKFTNAIGHNGKFYALSLQGSLVVIENINSCFVITSIVANRAIPSGVSRQFRECLVELDRDVLLVLLLSRKSISSVEDVEVYRMDCEGKLWERMESIGERALFVEDACCMGVDAARVGCKKNSVYFRCHEGDEWWVFDMGSGKILPAFGSGMQEIVKWEEPILEMAYG